MKTQSDSESPEHEEHLDQPRPQDLPIILKGWLKGAWGWFQHWRRRYCLHRLFILLFMFGPDCYRQLTRNAVLADLVSIAIGSIGVSSEPSVITARFHYFRTQRIKNLQQEILKIDHLETSSLENARATPLDCEALLLVEQAQGLGILAPEMDLPSIRQEAWVKAKQEHLLANEDNVARITKHMDDYYAPQNYLDWRTWEPGLAHLCNGVLTRWNWAGCSFLTVWVLCCALMAAAVTSFSQSRLPIILASAAAVVLIISILLADRRRIELSPGLLLFCFGLLALTVSSTIIGRYKALKTPLVWHIPWLILAMSLVIILWSVIPVYAIRYWSSNGGWVIRRIPGALAWLKKYTLGIGVILFVASMIEIWSVWLKPYIRYRQGAIHET